MCQIELWEEQRLGVFENRVLRGIFGAEREGVTGGRRKLHNDGLYSLYSSANVRRGKSW